MMHSGKVEHYLMTKVICHIVLRWTRYEMTKLNGTIPECITGIVNVGRKQLYLSMWRYVCLVEDAILQYTEQNTFTLCITQLVNTRWEWQVCGGDVDTVKTINHGLIKHILYLCPECNMERDVMCINWNDNNGKA